MCIGNRGAVGWSDWLDSIMLSSLLPIDNGPSDESQTCDIVTVRDCGLHQPPDQPPQLRPHAHAPIQQQAMQSLCPANGEKVRHKALLAMPPNRYAPRSVW